MTITVDVDLGYEFEVDAPFDDVFDLLSDVPASASFFPKLSKLTDLGGGVYRWEMDRVGPPQVNIRTVYASKYVANRANGTVVWTPVKTEGNARMGGSWTIADRKRRKDRKSRKNHGTALELKVRRHCRRAAAGADEAGGGTGRQGRIRKARRRVHRRADRPLRWRGMNRSAWRLK